MSQVGKFLNLHPHMESWGVYNVNGPYTSDYKIGSLAPAQFGGLSYIILEEIGGDVYVIQTESFGRCAIWAPVDEDSNITYERTYSNGDSSGSGGGSIVPGNGKYLNLHAHMQSWGVYNVDGPYTSAYKIGSLAPAQFGGLSYTILEEKGGDIYIIQTDNFGRCAIWAPRDEDSSITTSPQYSNGNTTGGGSTGSGEGKYLNLHAHMQSWGVYNVDGPYTSAYKIGSLAPAQFGGLSYTILEEKGGDVYIIQTDNFGRCAIWAPRDEDSSITTSPQYSNGNTTGGGSTGGGNPYPGGGTGDYSSKIFSRYEWGAKAIITSGMSGERTLPFRYIIVHHSAAEQFNSDISQMQSIQNYHQSLDWGDIGYHYGIGKFGMAMQGRETRYVGAHTRGERNSDSIGICLFGNFENYSPSQAQIDSLISLLTVLCKQYGLSPDCIMGHKDFMATDCPGSHLYTFLPTIKNLVRTKINDEPIVNEINALELTKKIGVEFAYVGQEILVAQNPSCKITLQNSYTTASDGGTEILNIENGQIVGGTHKTELVDFAIKLSGKYEFSLEREIIALGPNKTSVSVATTATNVSVSFIQAHEVSNGKTIKLTLKVEFSKDYIDKNPTAAAEVMDSIGEILMPVAIFVGAIIIMIFAPEIAVGTAVVGALGMFFMKFFDLNRSKNQG